MCCHSYEKWRCVYAVKQSTAIFQLPHWLNQTDRQTTLSLLLATSSLLCSAAWKHVHRQLEALQCLSYMWVDCRHSTVQEAAGWTYAWFHCVFVFAAKRSSRQSSVSCLHTRCQACSRVVNVEVPQLVRWMQLLLTCSIPSALRPRPLSHQVPSLSHFPCHWPQRVKSLPSEVTHWHQEGYKYFVPACPLHPVMPHLASDG